MSCQASKLKKRKISILIQIEKNKNFFSYKDREKQFVVTVDAHFGEAQQSEEAQQYGQRRVNGLIEKLLSPNGRNNGSQAHKVNKQVLRKATWLKGAQRKKQ